MRERLRRLFGRLTPSGTLLQQTVKSGAWQAGVNFSRRGLQILMLVVLARLLTPRDFGLMGIALLTLSATKQFTRIGLNAALIQQEKQNIDEYLDTAWCLEFGRGLLIAVVLFLSAPFIAGVFGEPRSANLIRVISLSPLLYGLRNPAVVYFRKDLDFHKEFLYQVSSGLSQFVVGVGYALVEPTVWALILGFISADVVRLGLSYVLHGYRPWPSFDRSVALEIIDYGKWITGASILRFVSSEGDDAFVGWFLSATALGFYQYAYRIADTPSTEVSEVVSRVTFPAYSKLQSDPDELGRALLSSTRFVAFLTIPMAFGIALVAPSFVPAILGPDWNPMILTMQLLAVYGALHAVTWNFGSVWKAVGRPDYLTKIGAVRIICIAVFIWPATAQWGIEGTAAVVVGVYLFPIFPVIVYLVAKEVELSSREIYREFSYPLAAGAAMFASLWYARGLVELSPLVEFLVLVPTGVVTYVLAVGLIEYHFDWGIEQNLRAIFDAIQ